MVRILKEDFLSYDDKFASRSGEDWLHLGLIGSMFLWKVLQGILQRGICLKTQVSKYKHMANWTPMFYALQNCYIIVPLPW